VISSETWLINRVPYLQSTTTTVKPTRKCGHFFLQIQKRTSHNLSVLQSIRRDCKETFSFCWSNIPQQSTTQKKVEFCTKHVLTDPQAYYSHDKIRRTIRKKMRMQSTRMNCPCDIHTSKESRKRKGTYACISSTVLGLSRGMNSTQVKSPRPNLSKQHQPAAINSSWKATNLKTTNHHISHNKLYNKNYLNNDNNPSATSVFITKKIQK
jgi:hypothetical protein